ncbi:hypothetical protein N7457_002895 [Penicillium paradoxum]|uniref:uncharacterized protein n=1 Tax=Penicillium paradoxum TaxID=176176 RepID=UPI002547704D|nr:uncharacterized protein N7457_002895 [Penicillium paradoxum]KAJ5787905.1 hypothetical protein N7457_002895 [Penicillium paradoxum]
MEPAGLAIGILGIAGLFNTCLDLVDKFESWKDFENESHSLDTQFETHKIRLERWGKTIGFEQGSLANNHHKLLDEPRTLSNIQDLLLAIENVCLYGDQPSQKPAPEAEKRGAREQISGRHPNSNMRVESKRQKLKWSWRNKVKRTAQVAQLSSLVDNLHSLIPINGGDSARGEKGQVDLIHQQDWMIELKRVLERIDGEIERETRKELRAWLLGDHVTNELYETYVERSVEGSCGWVLKRPWFINWASPDFPSGCAKVLWINGPAGFGKSILCAKIIEHLSPTMDVPVAHFFFSSDFESRGDPFVAIRSWLSQLISHPKSFESICDRWETWEKSRAQKATSGELVKLLQETVSAVPGCTLILDGLDECVLAREALPLDEKDSIMRFLGALRKVVTDTPTRVLIISRDETEIRHCLSNEGIFDSVVEYRITPEDVHNDVLSYARTIVSERLSTKTDAMKEDITQKLADRCNGQFLWVKLQQDTLRRGKSQKKLEEAINATPAGLDNIYERNWIKISRLADEDRDRAFSLLRWTAFSLRPLTVSEITAALLVQDDSDELLLDELPDSIDEDYINTELLDLCGSLLEIRSPEARCTIGLKTLHLTHFSVREYLLRNIPNHGLLLQVTAPTLRHSTATSESTILANKCLRYVNCQIAWEGTSDAQHDQILSSFRDYAAGAWYQHAAMGDMSDCELMTLTNELFNTSNPSWKLWKEWFDLNGVKREETEATHEVNLAGPLYYAVYLGLANTVGLLLSEGKHDMNEKGHDEQTALGAACENGHLMIVRLLLDQGADPTIGDMFGRTPLFTASQHGYVEVSRLLIEHGADADIPNNYGSTPIDVACYNGCTEVVKLLLAHGVDITVADENGWTPINSACESGHIEVAKLLLAYGADITVTNSKGWTPINLACHHGYAELVKLLIAHGADITVTDNSGWTPINSASESGYAEVVKMLLAHGADIDISTNSGWTPIHSASGSGYTEIVKILLAHGADINITTDNGWAPINSASESGHTELVEILLAHGADINIATNDGWTPINLASDLGHTEIVKILLAHGADINIATKKGWTPITSASESGHTEVVKILLAHGADINMASQKGWTPITSASEGGHTEVVKLLLEHSADINTAIKSGSTAINISSKKGHTEVVKLLLEQGADVTIANNNGWTPLDSAVHCGYIEIAQLLMEHGADSNIADGEGWTPLHIVSENGNIEMAKLLFTHGAIITASDDGTTPFSFACQNGHTEIVRLLLDHGADVTAVDNDGWTPLYMAAWNGHFDVIKLLLASDADVTIACEDGSTALHVASYRGHAKAVDTILQFSKIPIDVRDQFGRTPLSDAAARGHIEVVNLLLLHNALVNSMDRFLSTPLFMAVRNGHEEVVKRLIPLSDCNIDMEDGLGRSLFWWAARSQNREIARLFLRWAKESNVEVPQSDPDEEYSQLIPSTTYCDVCVRYICLNTLYHTCQVCYDFDICSECSKAGAQCLDSSHEWIVHQIDDSD